MSEMDPGWLWPGVAGLPVMARGNVIEGERDPFPPTRYDH
jgi:hypothetical protein